MKVKAYTCRKRNACSLYFCVFINITSILGMIGISKDVVKTRCFIRMPVHGRII